MFSNPKIPNIVFLTRSTFKSLKDPPACGSLVAHFFSPSYNFLLFNLLVLLLKTTIKENECLLADRFLVFDAQP